MRSRLLKSKPLTALACASLCFVFNAARADQADTLLPPPDVVMHVLAQHPSWKAQLAQTEADRARAEQTRVGSSEWAPAFSYGQRNSPSGEGQSHEWTVGVTRNLRLPAKTQADSTLSDAQVQTSQAQALQVWRTLSLAALQLHVDWLRERRIEGIWRAQIELVEKQLSVAKRRQELGDAAPIDATQLAGALAQAQAQKAAATQRRTALARKLNSQFMGWPLNESDQKTDTWPQADAALESLSGPLPTPSLQALVENHPDVMASNKVLDQAQASIKQLDADRLADPNVGVQYLQERNGAEHVLSVNLSWPIGGAYRALAHTAQVRHAQAVAMQNTDVRRRIESALQQSWQDVQEAKQRWQLTRHAEQQLDAVAAALDKGYTLHGEGQLSEVLQARRQAKEQALNAAQAEYDTWMALWRWQIESGERWPAP